VSKRNRHSRGQQQSGQQYNQGNQGYGRARESERGYATYPEEDQENGPRGQNWEEGRDREGRSQLQGSGRGEQEYYGRQDEEYGRGSGYGGPERGREFGPQSERYGRESWSGRSGRDEQDFGNWNRSQQWRPEPWQMDQGREYESGRNFEQAGYEPGSIDWERSGSGGRSGYGRDSGRQGFERGERETGSSESGRGLRSQGSYSQGSNGPHSGRGPSGYQRSDERIREDVCDRLTEHGLIDATEIQITVRGGEVTLQGSVDDRRMKHLAEDVVESVGGVKEVHNQLRVSRSEEGKKKEQGQESEQQKRNTVKT